ncbi:MAG: aminoglycoside phosphotransferase family protein [Patescibacteria group bacterium]
MEQDLLNHISEVYNLSSLIYVGSSAQGISAHNAIVKTTGGTFFFIKNYKKTDADRRENSEAVEIFVSENSSLPVVLPLKTASNQAHYIIDEKMYAVFPYLEHKEYKPELLEEKIKLAESLGATLGTIHSISMKVPINKSIQPIVSWIVPTKEKSIENLEKIIETINNKKVHDEYDKKALNFVDLKISLLKESSFRGRGATFETICHGDFHKGNILFDEKGSIIGICDWDISGRANPYLEFIRSFNMCVIRRDFEHYQEKGEYSKAFCAGYLKNCGFEFDFNELEYAIEWWYQLTLSISWPMSDHYYLDHTKTDASLDSEILKVSFLKENRAQLLEYIRSCIQN